MVEKGLSSTTIIDGNYCLERLEVFKRLQAAEGQSFMVPNSLETPGRTAEPGIPWRDGLGSWQGSLGRAGLCKGELTGMTVTVSVFTAHVFLGS